MSPPPDAADLDLLLSESEWFARLARGLVQDAATADDLVAETWLAALEAPAVRAPRAWLATVLRRRHGERSRSEQRRRRRERAAAAEEALPSTESLVERAELQREVAAALVALEEPYRTTVLLHYIEELNSTEIARRQGVPAGTVRSRLKRGLERLRERLDARNGGDRGRWLAALVPFARTSLPSAAAAWSLSGVLAMKLLLPGAAVILVATATLLFLGSGGGWFGRHTAELPAQAAPAASPGSERPEDTAQAGAAGAEAARVELEEQRGASAPSAAAARLLATFVDPDGRPVPGAFLESEQPAFRAEGDVAGRIDAPLELEERLTIEFRAGAEGFAPNDFHSTLDVGATVSLGEIVLVPAGSASGLVLDPSGRPVAGARVVVDDPEGARTDPEQLRRHGPKLPQHAPETESDAAGRFRIEGIAQGPARVWAGVEDFAWQTTGVIEITAGRDRPGLVLKLEPLRPDDWITGQVLDPGGDPVEGAFLIYFWTAARASGNGSLETDASGRFRLLVGDRSPHDFLIYDVENRFSRLVRTGVEPGVPDLVFQFVEARWFELLVIDESGAPVTRYAVTAWYVGHEHPYPLEEVALADHGEGLARMRRPTHEFELFLDAPGCSLHRDGPIVPAALSDRVTVRVTRLPSISGRVLAAGGPVSGAKVELHELLGNNELVTVDGHRALIDFQAKASARTDEDGWFDLTLRGRGRFVLTAEKSGFARAELPDLELDGDRGAEGLDVRMGTGGALEGRVIAPTPEEAAGVILSFSHGDGKPFTRRTGADGRYRVEGLTPGPWRVRVAKEELHLSRSTISYGYSMAPPPAIDWSCQVHEGQTTVHDVRLVAEGHARIDGLFLIDGRPAEGFTASLWGLRIGETTNEIRASTVIGGGGEFMLTVVEPGPCTLALSGDAGDGEIRFREKLELAAGVTRFEANVLSGSLRLTVDPPKPGLEQVLEYRWEEPAGGPRNGALGAEIRVRPDARGNAMLTRIPAGAGGLWRHVPRPGRIRGKWIELKRIEIKAGQETRVDLTSGH